MTTELSAVWTAWSEISLDGDFHGVDDRAQLYFLGHDPVMIGEIIL